MSVPVSLESFKDALKAIEEIPYTTGVIPLDKSTATLFFKTSDGSNASFVDLSNPTDSQLASLAAACQPATFGLDNQDILDETYRKAGKMDAGNFNLPFTPENVGLLDHLRHSILRGNDAEKKVHFELYKLNVYGPGSFFKPHVDTPRSDNQFGSLVFILPTKHEGGALVFRHGDKEWTFDSASAVSLPSADVSELSDLKSEAAYAAFFSDVEHEVLPVTSGYRVTVTYNLYFEQEPDSGSTSVGRSIPRNPAAVSLQSKLAALIQDPTFLPSGGFIGFGLAYAYAFDPLKTKLKSLVGRLKGNDHLIYQICLSLGLSPSRIRSYVKGEGTKTVACLIDHFPRFGGEQVDDDDFEGITQYFIHEEKGTQWIVESKSGGDQIKPGVKKNVGGFGRKKSLKANRIVWVRRAGELNAFKNSYIAYGNEAVQKYAYGKVCFVAELGAAEERIPGYQKEDEGQSLGLSSKNDQASRGE